MAVERTVAVMMPFGGDDQVAERRSVLDFLRIKYLLTKMVKVHLRNEPTEPINYLVTRVEAAGAPITPEALRQIKDADVVIGLITDQNANVVFELALRTAVRDLPILIVNENLKNPVPIYLADVEWFPFTKGDNDEIDTQCQEVAKNRLISCRTTDVAPPEGVARAIEMYDGRLLEDLQTALQRAEDSPTPKSLAWVAALFGDLYPGNVLSTWYNEYFPFSVVLQKWKKRTGGTNYLESDADGPAIVCAWNEAFLGLYQMEAPVARQTQLTLTELLRRLFDEDGDPEVQKLTKENYFEFCNEQNELTRKIVFGCVAETHGQVPLRFTERHSERYQNHDFLPCVIAKKTVGDTSRPHSMFLLVMYIDLPKPPPPRRGKRRHVPVAK